MKRNDSKLFFTEESTIMSLSGINQSVITRSVISGPDVEGRGQKDFSHGAMQCLRNVGSFAMITASAGRSVNNLDDSAESRSAPLSVGPFVAGLNLKLPALACALMTKI
ncbi:hypothetical protein AAKU67_000582 [Oxalobacteraceae bacterium GrIS 2.11]